VLVEALKSELFIWKWISAQALTSGVFFWFASGPGIPPTFDLGRRRSILWYAKQDSETTTLLAAVSQQRLLLRRLTLVNRVPKLRFESVSFIFLACLSFQREKKLWSHDAPNRKYRRLKKKRKKKTSYTFKKKLWTTVRTISKRIII